MGGEEGRGLAIRREGRKTWGQRPWREGGDIEEEGDGDRHGWGGRRAT